MPRLIAFAASIALAVLLWLFLRYTDTGKAIRAAAEEREGALLMGIDVRRLDSLAFGLGAALVAVAGSLVTPFLYVAPGRRGRVQHPGVRDRGARRHGELPRARSWAASWSGLAESLGAAVLPGSLKQLPIFALFVLVLLFRPNGLLGRART